ncbi:MAG: type IX secretion system sortase PorU [Candidatus Zhuqueibacterota bacterium]
MKINSSIRWFFIVSLLVSLQVGNLAAALAHDGLEVISSDDQGVTLRYTPRVERIDTVRVNNETYLKIYVAQASLFGDAGQPMVSKRLIKVGVPLQSEPTAQTLQAEFETISGRLLPAPTIEKNGVFLHEPDRDAYSAATDFPLDVIELMPPGFIRDQRVAEIQVHPIQAVGAKNQIKIYKSIVIRMDFNGSGGQSGVSKQSLPDEEFFRGVVVNFDQSEKWQKPRPQKSVRKASGLQMGEALKITIREEGLYKITGKDLQSAGVDISAINSGSLRLFNNGGRELSQSITAQRPDSLTEMAIRVFDGGDGAFNTSDYLVFYGQSVNGWEPLSETSPYYKHYIHHYTEDNIYFLTWDGTRAGRRMASRISQSDPMLTPTTYTLGIYYKEDEINNYLDSGTYWFGRLMAGNSDEQGYSAYLPHARTSQNSMFFRFQFHTLTYNIHQFNVLLNDQLVDIITVNGTRLYTETVSKILSLSASGYNSLKIQYHGDTSESQAYIDWFEIQYQTGFVAEDNALLFHQVDDGASKYRITNFTSNLIEVYDVTDAGDVQYISNPEIASGTVTFVDDAVGFPRRRFWATTTSAYATPESFERIQFANLRAQLAGAEFIIIAHDDFYDAAMMLKSHRENTDSISTSVVRIADIYNEFSGGLLDPVAIRDFIKFAFDNWVIAPKYVLLFGDGDFDYKNIKSDLDKNWIPPFETSELNENSSRAMDEWFILVSGDDADGDLAIGRFPVQTADEARFVVEKIIQYETESVLKTEGDVLLEDWRNVITMVGDDEYHDPGSQNETMHTRDAEYIMENAIPNYFNKVKIYLIEYPAIQNPAISGYMKPAATDALLKRINDGTLILNFVGHGAPSIWADERVLLESRDLDKILNYDKAPFWVAATCDFGRFDDPMEQGMAEKLFVAQRRGGIAFLTSSRLAYATDNTALNRQFFNQLFNGETPSARLGVALIQAKINNYSTTNDQKYNLYGDPTMRLKGPANRARIATVRPDSLKALSEINISGEVIQNSGLTSPFNGKAVLKVFDSKKNMIYTTKYGSQIRYAAPGRILFRGLIPIQQGDFDATCIIPKDITYGGEMGRISLYFADENNEGVTSKDSLYVGGTSILQDGEGPIIKIGFVGQNFADGNLISSDAVLQVDIADSISGVNIAGDIGHDITLTIDDQETDKIVLTDLFNYYEGNFKAGKILYDFSTYNSTAAEGTSSEESASGLTPGDHRITIKAWDNFNNSAIATCFVSVVFSDELKLKNVLNFPNPFRSSTTFTFVVNLPCRAKIKIFTIDGQLIQTVEHLTGAAGLNQVYWDGRDRDNDVLANGVYLYQVTVTTTEAGKSMQDEFIGKLVIMR